MDERRFLGTIDFVAVSESGNSCNGDATNVASLLLVGVVNASTEVEIGTIAYIKGGWAQICDTGDGVVYNLKPLSVFDTEAGVWLGCCS